MAKKKARKKAKKKANVLKRVKPEFYFVVVDGKKIKNLPELAIALDSMTEEVFSHHVTDERNDFANWVRDAIGEIELADKIMGIDSKTDTQLQLLKHIVKKVR